MIKPLGKNTKDIYDFNASSWVRNHPNSLSDFTGRPKIIDLCGDIKNLKVLDLGCGEGYGARALINRGAALVEGIDISQKMINLAREKEKDKLSKINYQVCDIKKLPFNSETFDLVIGIFVFNYLYVDETLISMREIFRVLKKKGKFVFGIPHPSFPQIKQNDDEPFYFDFKKGGYFSSRDKKFEGFICCRDGKKLPVQMIHKLIEDYFFCLKESGFNSLPEIKELGVLKEHLDLEREFFEPVNDIPLHLAIAINK